MDLTEADFHKPGMVFQIGNEPQRIDIISAADGLDYADAAKRAVKMMVDGLELKVISLDDLIVNKRASGRPKDLADALTLEKIRDNPAQSTMKDAAARHANVMGVYRAVMPERFAGRRVLLIDDIITTGATLSECSFVLLNAGAAEVLCATVAATQFSNN